VKEVTGDGIPGWTLDVEPRTPDDRPPAKKGGAMEMEKPGGSRPLKYGSRFHTPVLYEAVIEGIVTKSGGVYVDATLGGGGHSAALLDVLSPRGRVVGIDQDVEALEAARSLLAADIERKRFTALQGNFEHLERLLAEVGVTEIDGLLLDLGVSSHQLDTAQRGFSYLSEAELDMRMDPHAGVSAHDVVNVGQERSEGLIVRLW